MASSLLLLSCASHAIPAARTRILLPHTSSPRARRCPTCLVAVKSEAQQPRRSGNYPPSLWDDAHIQSITRDFNEEPSDRIEKLKEDVKGLLKEEKEVVEQLELVDVLQQLGVAYHFEEEIIEALANIYESIEELNVKMKEDLYATALLFRLLREHGFSVSQDVFNSFRDQTGSFKSCLRYDSKGLLSLYEASYFGIEDETIVDEARDFTTKHLKDLIRENPNSLDSFFSEKVKYALELPLNLRMQRLHTRWFIERYERNDDMNHILLEFAKLDFNMVQRLHKKELSQLSRWWDDMGLLVDKLSFCRDRLVENYFWSVGWAFEPKLEKCREAWTKFNCFITTIDDIYDVYGSLDELELFTNAVERWELSAIEQLPEYMKICLLGLFNTANHITYKVLKDYNVDITPFLKSAWVALCKSYLVEANWYHKNHTPTINEYMENAWISISGGVILTTAYCVNEDITVGVLENFKNYLDIMRSSSMILRLSDDLATSTEELKRGDVQKSIQCYIYEKGISESLARDQMKDLIGLLWKRLNRARILGASRFEKNFKIAAFNLPRTAQCIYQHGDGYGMYAENETKDRIVSVLIEPILLSKMSDHS